MRVLVVELVVSPEKAHKPRPVDESKMLWLSRVQSFSLPASARAIPAQCTLQSASLLIPSTSLALFSPPFGPFACGDSSLSPPCPAVGR